MSGGNVGGWVGVVNSWVATVCFDRSSIDGNGWLLNKLSILGCLVGVSGVKSKLGGSMNIQYYGW